MFAEERHNSFSWSETKEGPLSLILREQMFECGAEEVYNPATILGIPACSSICRSLQWQATAPATSSHSHRQLHRTFFKYIDSLCANMTPSFVSCPRE